MPDVSGYTAELYVSSPGVAKPKIRKPKYVEPPRDRMYGRERERRQPPGRYYICDRYCRIFGWTGWYYLHQLGATLTTCRFETYLDAELVYWLVGGMTVRDTELRAWIKEFTDPHCTKKLTETSIPAINLDGGMPWS